MKKIIFALTLMLLSLNVVAQNNNVLKIKLVSRFVCGGEWENINLLSILNANDKTFTIYSEQKIRFDIVKSVIPEDDELLRAVAVDDDGKSCDLYITNDGFLTLLYDDFFVVYKIAPIND